VSEAVLAQLYAIRAAVDAAIIQAQSQPSQGAPPPTDPAETCPYCGASGETQRDTSALAGPKTVLCLRCQKERTL
jgi:hypothetical protein